MMTENKSSGKSFAEIAIVAVASRLNPKFFAHRIQSTTYFESVYRSRPKREDEASFIFYGPLASKAKSKSSCVERDLQFAELFFKMWMCWFALEIRQEYI